MAQRMSTALLLAAVLVAAPPRAIFVTGNSVANGCASTPALSTSQVGGNEYPTGQVEACFQYTAPLVPWPGAALAEASTESPRSGIANYYYTATGNSLFVGANGYSGVPYTAYLDRGSGQWTFFDQIITQWGARTEGDSVLGLVIIHGEADRLSATYTSEILAWQSDFDANVRAHTSSRLPHYAWLLQMSSCTFYGDTTCIGHISQYNAARTSNKVKLVGPRYQYAYADGVHLTNSASRAAGAMIGKAIVAGESWQPLWPRASSPVSRTNNVITLYLYTPVPPLVVDTTTVTGVSASTRGFEYTDDSSPPSITAVDCSAACSGNICSCQITLSGTPTGANKKLRYAYTGTPGAFAGPTTGMRGNIRDSDTATWQGANLYNWLVHFEETVP